MTKENLKLIIDSLENPNTKLVGRSPNDKDIIITVKKEFNPNFREFPYVIRRGGIRETNCNLFILKDYISKFDCNYELVTETVLKIQ